MNEELEVITPFVDLVGPRDLAKRLRKFGITETWLREAADDGEIPCLRIGKRMLFDHAAVLWKLRALASKASPKEEARPAANAEEWHAQMSARVAKIKEREASDAVS